jgi:hypothetical protein
MNEISCYRKTIILVGLFALICGCVPTINTSLLTAVSVVSGKQKITVSSPTGFCVDQKLANKSSSSITLFIIDCIRVSDQNGVSVRRRPLSAILTATVIDYNNLKVTSISELKNILTEKPGINYLSKSNTTAMLKVHQVEQAKNILIFLIEQRSPNIGVKQSNYFWRSFFFTKGKLIAMTASNFSDDKNSQMKLRKLLLEFSNRTLLANTI